MLVSERGQTWPDGDVFSGHAARARAALPDAEVRDAAHQAAGRIGAGAGGWTFSGYDPSGAYAETRGDEEPDPLVEAAGAFANQKIQSLGADAAGDGARRDSRTAPSGRPSGESYWGDGAVNYAYDTLADGPVRAVDPQGSTVLTGRMSGRVLTGHWIRYDGGVRCDALIEDSRNWGKIRFEFNEAFTRFEGRWADCEGEFHSDWTGNRQAGPTPPVTAPAPTQTTEWATEQGGFALHTLAPGPVRADDRQFGGVADIVGQMSDRTLTGHWIRKDGFARCESQREGSLNWGRVRFRFDPSYRTFRGSYGLCEEAPSIAWSGHRPDQASAAIRNRRP